MSDGNLQKFIQRSILRESTGTYGEKRFSKKCLCYLLPFLSRFQMFLFYQKKREKTLCKDILRHIYEFYGNSKIILPNPYHILSKYYTLNSIYFFDITLTRKILEKTVMCSGMNNIILKYYTSYEFINSIKLIDAVLSNIEEGIDLEENEKILNILKKNKMDIPKRYRKLPKMDPDKKNCSKIIPSPILEPIGKEIIM